ncbi:extracellular solute-binding protein [Oceanivirga salmonicida]|uniref:extracellular solute-binding protein n=1 Tax=Oceanivirga salmonicida TaxID=1769291 RepID=UPI0012E215BE|nr:extracellular solute-binding protein [Oceanivirga salmonicida]
MKKRIVISLLSLLALASCGSEKKEEANAKTTIFAVHLGKALDPSLPVFKEAAKKTGIELESVASKNETNQVKSYNLMLSSSPLPDIIAYELSNELENLGIEGGLIPLEDLIKEHAPNLKKFFDENPRYLKDAVAVDGHIYMIPNYYDWFNISVSQGYFLRKDWLKKLNLQEPKTVDELYQVLKAFKEKDPNGNGKQDEVPFFTRGNIPRKNLMSLVDIFKASVIWYDDNGIPKYGPAQEEYKVAMKTLAKWYKEGLIDKEVFTRGLKSRDYLLSNDLGGATSDWIASTSSYNSKLKDKIEGFDFSLILPPVYNGNNKTRHTRPTYLGGWSISKDAKDPVKLIKYFDFWYSEEGRRLWNFGIEGEDYTIVDGKPVFTDKILKDKDGKNPLAVIRSTGAQFRLGMQQDVNYEYGWASESAVEGYKLYQNSGVIIPDLPILKYTKEESKEFTTIDANMRAYIEQKSQEWILGVSDVDKDWNEYIQRLNALGLEKANEIQKKAYDRFTK